MMPSPRTGFHALHVPDGAGGESVMLMDPLGGRDQIVAMAAAASWNTFERPFPSMFHACIAASPGMVIDVGANTGFYALLATRASPDVCVLAFEPYGPVYEVLGRNIAANAIRGRIESLPLALSDHAGNATLYVPTQEHGLMETSSSLEEEFRPGHSEALMVETRTLDTFLASHPCADKRITLIKVDVEGHEAAVLAGARATIARWRPMLFIEVLPMADMAALTRLLAENDYIDVPLRPDVPLRAEAEVRHHTDAWNHALVPTEGAARFLQLPTG